MGLRTGIRGRRRPGAAVLTRNQTALLIALGADNFGSGLFLPLALVFVPVVVGLPLAAAGTAVALGTAAGLVIPPIAGRLVDRIGPRPVVITAQLLQALGALTYLTANGFTLVVLAAVLLATGQQLFYSSLFALLSDVAGHGPKDRPFAVAAMVRSACFGLGGLVGGLLATTGPAGYRATVAADAVSFLLCAVLLHFMVRTTHVHQPAESGSIRLWSDKPFLALIGITGLAALTGDFFLVGAPVYIQQVHAQPWLSGTVIALLTGLTSVGGTLALRLTRRLSRTASMVLGAALSIVWCVASLAAIAVPSGWRPAVLLGATLVIAAAMLLGMRGNVLAEAVAPPAARGRYLAAFQYAFTFAGILAPAVVALFSVAIWLPWLVTAVTAGAAIYGLRRLTPRLPSHALWPDAFSSPRTR